MARPRKVDVGGWTGAVQAYNYKARALDAPDGDRITVDPRAARKALNAITTITPSAMER